MSATDLVGELKLLRKGRGISVVQLGPRVGEAMRAAFGITGSDDTAEIRRKLTESLVGLAGSLPDDLRTAALAAFGLHEQARHPFLQARVGWVAKALDRDERTARRRIDEGIQRIAELAVSAQNGQSEPAYPSRSWHTEELRVALALDQQVPEVFEVRRVVADADDIEELDLAVTLTNAGKRRETMVGNDLEVDVFYGGRLAEPVMESSERFGLMLRLPKPLARRARHDIALRFRAKLRHPHYVCVPRHPVDLFDLHVKFPRSVPGAIVKLENVFQDDARDPAARGERLTANESGEVHVQFRNLAPGFAYGVRWEPADVS
ncbi:hypothetical protein [Amycolatopsis xylanica]|uniref:hypothetical protein n=1 Tax=Amycolatopsis xylanica TaxID=589385 RepID=UPI001FE02A0B|nr:hypothetical protein [Amycolatopsis xylanica]